MEDKVEIGEAKSKYFNGWGVARNTSISSGESSRAYWHRNSSYDVMTGRMTVIQNYSKQFQMKSNHDFELKVLFWKELCTT